jgi:hypothetical protein
LVAVVAVAEEVARDFLEARERIVPARWDFSVERRDWRISKVG